MKSVAMMLGLGMCTSMPGSFCDIAEPQRYSSEEIVRVLVEKDPEHLRTDLAMNRYGEANCDWEF